MSKIILIDMLLETIFTTINRIKEIVAMTDEQADKELELERERRARQKARLESDIKAQEETTFESL